jgi:hypothetical protein
MSLRSARSQEGERDPEESISRLTLRENELVRRWMDLDLNKSVSAEHKDVSLSETNLSIQKQKKLMRMMKQQIQGVLGHKANQNQFDAFDIEDEAFEKRVVRVGMDEHSNLVQSGRIRIKNRIKDFNVSFLKAGPTASTAIKIYVSIDDMSFKTSTEHQLIKESRVVIPISIPMPNPHKFVYFKVVQDEDDIEIDQDDSFRQQVLSRQGSRLGDKFIKVLFHFGINNYNKLIA